MERNPIKSLWLVSVERLRDSLDRSVSGLASTPARVIMLVLGMVFLVWQLYVFAWLPLREARGLPQGVEGEQVVVETEHLEFVQGERQRRLEWTVNLFSDGDTFFLLPAATPTVAPVP